MPSLVADRKGNFNLSFRWAGRQYMRGLGTRDRRIAEAAATRAEEMLSRLKLGYAQIPPGADVATFVVSGGTATGLEEEAPEAMTLGRLFETYQGRIAGKAESTRYTEDRHITLLGSLMGERTALAAFTLATAQAYADRRLKPGRGKLAVKPRTIRAELKTLGIVWNWAHGRVDGVPRLPVKLADVTLPKERAPIPFRTRAEIERTVGRGGLSKAEVAELWGALYLTVDEVREVMEIIRGREFAPWIYPMAMAAAYTGARRSELCRSRVGDWDLDAGTVAVRQKKQDHGVEFSFRHVDIASPLADVMADWLGRHPGGQHAFAHSDAAAVRPDSASYYLDQSLAGSRWAVVTGWHIFRHSFASNLACAGVDQRVIDAWMGHSTEIRLRYQHLVPKVRRDSIEMLTGRPGEGRGQGK